MTTPKIDGPHGRAIPDIPNPNSETVPSGREPNPIDKANTPGTRTAFEAEGLTLSDNGHRARPKGR